MKNVIKKLVIAIIIAGLGSFILYHVMFALSYYVEEIFNGIEMEDGIPVYGLVSLLAFIVLFVISFRKKDTTKYYMSIGFLSIFISCLAIMLSFDGEFISVNGVYVTKNNGKYGIVNKWGNEIIPCQFDTRDTFYNSDNRYDTEDRVCIFGKDNSFYIATKDGLLLPAERWVSPDFDAEKDAKYGNREYGWISHEETYGFITCVGDKFNLINFNGEKVIPEDFDEYAKYPYGDYLWVAVDGKWNAYDVTSRDIDKIANVDFDECRPTADGMLLKYGEDVILARTDEGDMMFFNLSEQQRQEEQNRQNALLLLMIFSQMNNNYQYSQMNNLYQNYNVYGRPRETIEAEIRKFENEKAYCESHLGDGIAESMGYSGIISKYDNMIEDRKQELMMSNR